MAYMPKLNADFFRPGRTLEDYESVVESQEQDFSKGEDPEEKSLDVSYEEAKKKIFANKGAAPKTKLDSKALRVEKDPKGYDLDQAWEAYKHKRGLSVAKKESNEDMSRFGVKTDTKDLHAFAKVASHIPDIGVTAEDPYPIQAIEKDFDGKAFLKDLNDYAATEIEGAEDFFSVDMLARVAPQSLMKTVYGIGRWVLYEAPKSAYTASLALMDKVYNVIGTDMGQQKMGEGFYKDAYYDDPVTGLQIPLEMDAHDTIIFEELFGQAEGFGNLFLQLVGAETNLSGPKQFDEKGVPQPRIKGPNWDRAVDKLYSDPFGYFLGFVVLLHQSAEARRMLKGKAADGTRAGEGPAVVPQDPNTPGGGGPGLFLDAENISAQEALHRQRKPGPYEMGPPRFAERNPFEHYKAEDVPVVEQDVPATSATADLPPDLQELPKVYRSGAASPTIMRGYLDVQEIGVGIEASKLSPRVKRQVFEAGQKGKSFFIDSGAFPAFREMLKAIETDLKKEMGKAWKDLPKPERDGLVFSRVTNPEYARIAKVDFDKVMVEYAELLEGMGPNQKIVAPDIIGDQSATLALQDRYKKQMMDFKDKGAEILVPLQVGEMPLADVWKRVKDSYGEDVRVALPSNERAAPLGEIQKLFESEGRPDKVHFLGISPKSGRWPAIQEMMNRVAPDVDITADATLVRSKVGFYDKAKTKPKPITEERARVMESVIKRFEKAPPEEQTRMIFKSKVLPDAEVATLLKKLGIKDKAEIAKLVPMADRGDLLPYLLKHYPLSKIHGLVKGKVKDAAGVIGQRRAVAKTAPEATMRSGLIPAKEMADIVRAARTMIARSDAAVMSKKLVGRMIDRGKEFVGDVLHSGRGRDIYTTKLLESVTRGKVVEHDPNIKSISKYPKGKKFRAIVQNYVLNTVELGTRKTILKQLSDSLATGGELYVSVRSIKDNAWKKPGWIKYEDGYKSPKGTFQKFYTEAELIKELRHSFNEVEIVKGGAGGAGIAAIARKPYSGVEFRSGLMPRMEDVKALGRTAVEMYNAAKRKFGVTEDPGRAGWLLPTGEMLDFGKVGDKTAPGRYLEHMGIGQAIKKWIKGDEFLPVEDLRYQGEGWFYSNSIETFGKNGNIRMSYADNVGQIARDAFGGELGRDVFGKISDRPLVMLEVWGEPTSAQLAKIKSLVGKDGEIMLDISRDGKLVTSGTFEGARGYNQMLRLFAEEPWREGWSEVWDLDKDPGGGTTLRSGLLPIDVAFKATKELIKGVKQLRDWAADVLDVEDRYARLGAKMTGLFMKIKPSVEAMFEQQGIVQIKRWNDMLRKELFNNKRILSTADREVLINIYHEAVKGAESQSYYRKMPTGPAKRIAKDLTDAFYVARRELRKRGYNVNFKQRLWREIEAERAHAIQINDMTKVAELDAALESLADYNFVHIPTAFWMEANFRDPAFQGRVLKMLNSKKRKTFTIMEMMEKFDLTKEQVGAPSIIASYYRRLGKDISLLDVINAAKAEGLASEQPFTVAGAQSVRFKGYESPLLAKYHLHPLFKDHLSRLYVESKLPTSALGRGVAKFDRAVNVTKMLAFYNPVILPMYDVVQASLRMGWESYKLPKYIYEGFKEGLGKTPEYWEAQRWGLSSKPFNNAFETYMQFVERAQMSAWELLKRDTSPTAQLSRITQKKGLERIPLLPEVYNASWFWAWEFDSAIRMGTYKFLKDKGYSPRDAAQTAALYHGDYASVPHETRRMLNRALFTPTFKIAMGKLYKRMLTDAMKLDFGKESFAKSLITIAAIQFAMDTVMTRGLGFTREEFARRYYKEANDEEGFPMDYVMSFSNPAQMWNKFFFRAKEAYHTPIPIASFIAMNKSELTPLIRTFFEVVSGESMSTGKMYDWQFDSPQYCAKKALKYIIPNTLGIMRETSLFQAKKDKTARYMAVQEFGKIGAMVQQLVSFGYARSPHYRSVMYRLKEQRSRFEQYLRKRILDGEDIDDKSFDRYLNEQMRLIDKL